MPLYLVEAYVSAVSPALSEACADARAAAAHGAGVRHVRTTFLPDDELCLHLFDAGSHDELRRAVEAAGLTHERIVAAVEPT